MIRRGFLTLGLAGTGVLVAGGAGVVEPVQRGKHELDVLDGTCDVPGCHTGSFFLGPGAAVARVPPPPPRSMTTSSAIAGRIGGLLGLLSAGTLAASIVWVHHWGARSDAIVGVWAVSTIGAFWLSRRTLRTSDEARTAAKLGLALALVSVLALVFAGIAYAAGGDPAGACGGG